MTFVNQLKELLLLVLLALFISNTYAQELKADNLPDSIYSGKHGKRHVQGIAVDKMNGFVYYSFTDKLVKTDLSGNLIGSVAGYVGHLGSIDFDPRTNTIYGSLEYKNDAIVQNKENGFYIALFDGAAIVENNMDGENDEVMKAAYLDEVVKDYEAKVKYKDSIVEHRFGSSGIDGTTLGPSFGKKNKNKKYLYVAYGIYGDTLRDDNDSQVILKYKIKSLRKLSKGLTQANPHKSGPKSPLGKYFIKTGNTTYGIQNLEYDNFTGNFFAAVYKGKKLEYPNYSLFIIDGHKKPGKTEILSDEKTITVDTLSLLQAGSEESNNVIRGWNFKWGATGLFSLGNGLFYISHNRKTKDEQQETTIHKYKWIGCENKAFELVK